MKVLLFTFAHRCSSFSWIFIAVRLIFEVSFFAISSPPPWVFLFRMMHSLYPLIAMLVFPTIFVSTIIIRSGWYNIEAAWRLSNLLRSPFALAYNIFISLVGLICFGCQYCLCLRGGDLACL